MNSTKIRRCFLTPAEVADILGVSTKTVQNYCNAGIIPAKRIGRLWHIPEKAIDEIIKIKEAKS